MKTAPVPRPDHKGIVKAEVGLSRFALDRHPVDPGLGAWVEHYWEVSYSLPAGETHSQTVLSFPNLHLAFERYDGADPQALVYGVPLRTFTRELAGEGLVLGARFRPGGFRAFYGRDVLELRGKVVPASQLWGAEVEVLARRLLAEGMPDLSLLDRFLMGLDPAPDAEAELAAELVDLAERDPSLRKAEDLARRAGMAIRSLQRLFRRYVGVGPKWVLMRFRLQEAALLLESDVAPPWPELALRLGYFDQSHFVNDFKAMLGVTPARYRETKG